MTTVATTYALTLLLWTPSGTREAMMIKVPGFTSRDECLRSPQLQSAQALLPLGFTYLYGCDPELPAVPVVFAKR